MQARITLARAIYSDSAVVLLDDVFSALDTLTSRWIIDNCFRGDLVEGRTILLVVSIGLHEDMLIRRLITLPLLLLLLLTSSP
jgi:ABC-type nitrate/sulfonate/bicarbonate transport system ATPase subunit